MKFKAIIGAVTYTLKKYSPEILLGVGLFGVAAGTILACKATLKAEGILDEHAEQSGRIDDCVLLRNKAEVEYTVQDEKMDRRDLMFATAGKFIRLYGPPVTLMLASFACILGSYRIMAKRNVALMAAYKLIEEAFTKYRKRVAAELGEKTDAHFMYGEEAIEGAETRKYTDADGVEHELTRVLNHLSGFARFFEADTPDQMGGWTGSTQWSKVHEYNVDFLTAKEQHFNNMLVVKGDVTMNDVFDEIGFPRTEAGMICGWRYKSDRGDGYISFRPRGVDGNWTYGQNGDCIITDFNIDGVIFDQDIARKEMK